MSGAAKLDPCDFRSWPAAQAADEASAPEGAPPAAEPVPAPQAELPGIPDDTEGGGDDLPYGHPDDETGAAEEGFGLEGAWTADPSMIDAARLRARLVQQLEAGHTLEGELRAIRRKLRRQQERQFLERELMRMQSIARGREALVRKLAAVLTLMADGAESAAAAIHCTDADDDEWLQRWAAADPWGRQLVSHAREALWRAWS